ncbi:hypothetical protein Tco_1316951 [Tanacetum coccineum]
MKSSQSKEGGYMKTRGWSGNIGTLKRDRERSPKPPEGKDTYGRKKHKGLGNTQCVNKRGFDKEKCLPTLEALKESIALD